MLPPPFKTLLKIYLGGPLMNVSLIRINIVLEDVIMLCVQMSIFVTWH